jgi:hypothetical protein
LFGAATIRVTSTIAVRQLADNSVATIDEEMALDE